MYFTKKPLHEQRNQYDGVSAGQDSGIEKNERITEDATAEILKEAVQISYRRGGEEYSLKGTVSKQTVKAKLHGLKFPKDTNAQDN